MAGKKGTTHVDLGKQPEGKPMLRIRNISGYGICLPSADPKRIDLVLSPHQEVIDPGEMWANDRYLRAALESGLIEVEWVERTQMPRTLPTTEDVPLDLRPENKFDCNYALQLALTLNVDDVLSNIRVNVKVPETSMTDVSFMKGRMLPILRMALWLEPRLQNRARVIKAIKTRMDEIRVM